MNVPSLGVSPEYVYCRVHGAWARAFTGDRLNELLARPSPQALAAALGALGVASEGGGLNEGALGARIVDDLAAIRRLVDSDSAVFCSCWIGRYYLDNVKAVLKIRALGGTVGELDSRLIRSPCLPAFDAEVLLRAGATAQLFKDIPEHPWRALLRPIVETVDRQQDLFETETALDALFYAELLKAAAALEEETREVGIKLTCMEIDIANAIVALRNVVHYHLPAERVSRCWVGAGRMLGRAQLAALAACTTPEQVRRELPPGYAGLFETANAATLPAVEVALWRHLMRKAHAAFRDASCPAASAIAYPFLKRGEQVTLTRLAEAIRLGAEPEAIRDALWEVPRV